MALKFKSQPAKAAWYVAAVAIAILFFLLPVPAAADRALAVNLLANGSFEQPGGMIAMGWQRLGSAGSVSVVHDDSANRFRSWQIYPGASNCFLSVKSDDPNGQVGATTSVPLSSGVKHLVLTGTMSVPSLRLGSSSAGARCYLLFRMANGSIITCPSSPACTSACFWKLFYAETDVPDGAIGVIVSPLLDHCAGELQITDLGLQTSPREPKRWIETFDDEFNGSSLDTSKWTPTVGNLDWQIREGYLSAFSASNARLSGGCLHLVADQKSTGSQPFTSAELLSIGKFVQLYGCIETRVRMPKAAGTWPAIYLIPEDDTWPPEIDVDEATGCWPNFRMVNDHWRDYDGVHLQWSGTADAPGYDRSQWHVRRVVWDANMIRYYDDGVLVGATSPTTGVADMPMYLRVNLVVGAWGATAPDPSGSGGMSKTRITDQWPQTFDIDYIRVYQRSDRPLPVEVSASQEITQPQSTVALKVLSCNPMTGAVGTWTLVGGPAAAVIASPHALVTQATCSAPGMYRFRFTVEKDGDSGSADTLVYVNPPIPQQVKEAAK